MRVRRLWEFNELRLRAYEKVVHRITNSCVGQAVVIIIIVVYMYKFEQWHISSANNKDSLIETKTNFCFYCGCNQRTHI